MPTPPTPGPDSRPSSALRAEGSPAKRTYRRPAILARETIETMAADCTIPGGKNDAACILGFS